MDITPKRLSQSELIGKYTPYLQNYDKVCPSCHNESSASGKQKICYRCKLGWFECSTHGFIVDHIGKKINCEECKKECIII